MSGGVAPFTFGISERTSRRARYKIPTSREQFSAICIGEHESVSGKIRVRFRILAIQKKNTYSHKRG